MANKDDPALAPLFAAMKSATAGVTAMAKVIDSGSVLFAATHSSREVAIETMYLAKDSNSIPKPFLKLSKAIPGRPLATGPARLPQLHKGDMMTTATSINKELRSPWSRDQRLLDRISDTTLVGAQDTTTTGLNEIEVAIAILLLSYATSYPESTLARHASEVVQAAKLVNPSSEHEKVCKLATALVIKLEQLAKAHLTELPGGNAGPSHSKNNPKEPEVPKSTTKRSAIDGITRKSVRDMRLMIDGYKENLGISTKAMEPKNTDRESDPKAITDKTVTDMAAKDLAKAIEDGQAHVKDQLLRYHLTHPPEILPNFAASRYVALACQLL